MKVFPCQGTPFAKPRPALVIWFLAIDLVVREKAGARALRRRLDLDARGAAEVEAGIQRLEAAPDPAMGARWLAEIAAFVEVRRAATQLRPAIRSEVERETLWESLRALAAIAKVEQRPFLGLAAVALLALLGAGIGWLIVPPASEPDDEVAQATATLTLGEDKPVILVSPDVAAQLYDVTDVDADPNSPLASSIRIAPRPRSGESVVLSGAQPVAPPAVKLSAGVGKSLVEGDTGAVQASARNRPELAAYTALARELEGKGPRNPDEL